MNCVQNNREPEYLDDSTKPSDSAPCQLRWLWITWDILCHVEEGGCKNLGPWVPRMSRGFLPTWSGHAVWVINTLLFQATEILELLVMQHNLSYSEGYTYLSQRQKEVMELRCKFSSVWLRGQSSATASLSAARGLLKPNLELGLMSKIQHCIASKKLKHEDVDKT